MSKIDEILDDAMGASAFQQLHKEEVKQALYKDMVAILGEDEMTPALARKLGYKGTPNSMAQFHNINGRDDLRQELRTKLKEYYGVEDAKQD